MGHGTRLAVEWEKTDLSFLLYTLGGQSSVVIKRPHCYHGDVGSNPTTTRNENQTLGDPPTEGSQRVWTGSKWKTGDVKAKLDL